MLVWRFKLSLALISGNMRPLKRATRARLLRLAKERTPDRRRLVADNVGLGAGLSLANISGNMRPLKRATQGRSLRLEK